MTKILKADEEIRTLPISYENLEQSKIFNAVVGIKRLVQQVLSHFEQVDHPDHLCNNMT